MSRDPGAALLLALGLGLTAPSGCDVGGFCAEGAPGCADPGCHDGVKDGAETDVDCGGSCGPCAAGQVCAAAQDCASGRCAAAVCCEAPCGLWARSFGGIVDDAATTVAAAPDGSVYVAGTFSGAVDLGGGPLVSRGGADVFVLRLDAAGKHLWSLRLGGALDEGGARLALTASGHPVVALTSPDPGLDLGGGALAADGGSNLYLVELDAQGKHVWSRAQAGAIEMGGIAVAPGGDLLFVGAFAGALSPGGAAKLSSGGANDVLLLRLTPTGEPRWGKRYGSLWGDQGRAVAAGADGSIYVLARYSRSWTFGGPKLPDSGGSFGTAVAHLDAQGKHLWSRGWTSVEVNVYGYHDPSAIVADNRGGLWLTGEYLAPVDFGAGSLPAGVGSSAMVVKLDAETGALAWARSFGEHTAGARAMVADGAGGVVLSGHYKGDVDFGGGVALAAGLDQLFVARLDAAGGAVWARGLEAGATDLPAALAARPGQGLFFLAGGFRGTLDAGTGPLSSAGDGTSDAFAAALGL